MPYILIQYVWDCPCHTLRVASKNHFKGLSVKRNLQNYIFLYIFAVKNSADPDEMHLTYHLPLHCLQ